MCWQMNFKSEEWGKWDFKAFLKGMDFIGNNLNVNLQNITQESYGIAYFY